MDATKVAKELRAELKREYPQYKFSVTSDYSSMTVALMAGPVWPFVDKNCEGYDQLNHYYLDKFYPGVIIPEVLEMLQKVNKMANRNNYDHSDIQTDYFDVGYYFSLHIGKWDRPYQVQSA